MSAYFPIIYVRGYAFRDREVEETTDDPTNGFNLGTTHARQGRGELPIKYRFPGPFVRLMTDHHYRDVMSTGRDSLVGLKDKRRTLWIHRYYELYSDTFAEPGKAGRPSIEQAAVELKGLIDRIRDECFNPSETDRRVILIAHSMGGLICRSLIQRILDEPAKNIIEKVVTYGTPHGGIPFSSGLLWYHGLSNFTHEELFRCLAPKGTKYSKAFDPQELTNFPADRFLCVIGTNYSDYEPFFRIPGARVGEGSDGLVLQQRAWVNNAPRVYAPRVYVHRSHSGRYGLVSSPEAFHAVERFLFGDLRAALLVEGDGQSPPSPDGPSGGVGNFLTSLLDIECTITPQGLRVNDRRADNMSAMRLLSSRDRALNMQEEDNSLFVFHFLNSDEADGEYQFAVSLKIRVDHYQNDGLVRSEIALLQSLSVWVVNAEGTFFVRYRWLGEEEVSEWVEGDLPISVPSRGFSDTWNGGSLSLVLQLAWDDKENPGSGERGGEPVTDGNEGGTVDVSSDSQNNAATESEKVAEGKEEPVFS